MQLQELKARREAQLSVLFSLPVYVCTDIPVFDQNWQVTVLHFSGSDPITCAIMTGAGETLQCFSYHCPGRRCLAEKKNVILTAKLLPWVQPGYEAR